jgi:hypothetical protein
MHVRRTFALGGAIVALALVLGFSTASLAAGTSGTTVSVRIEGKNRTLLPATVVHTHSGSITRGGTPKGVCPATSAAGALDVATHHKWNGSYGSFGLSVTQILGETHPLSPPRYYWSIWVNNRYAPTGVCGLKLHRGEQLLFAAVSDKGSPFPLVLTVPSQATAGHPFNLKVSYFNAKGVSKPLAGAHVAGPGLNAVSNKQGVVSVAAQHTGKLKYNASEKGYIRAATLTVRVS